MTLFQMTLASLSSEPKSESTSETSSVSHSHESFPMMSNLWNELIYIYIYIYIYMYIYIYIYIHIYIYIYIYMCLQLHFQQLVQTIIRQQAKICYTRQSTINITRQYLPSTSPPPYSYYARPAIARGGVTGRPPPPHLPSSQLGLVLVWSDGRGGYPDQVNPPLPNHLEPVWR